MRQARSVPLPQVRCLRSQLSVHRAVIPNSAPSHPVHFLVQVGRKTGSERQQRLSVWRGPPPDSSWNEPVITSCIDPRRICGASCRRGPVLVFPPLQGGSCLGVCQFRSCSDGQGRRRRAGGTSEKSAGESPGSASRRIAILVMRRPAWSGSTWAGTEQGHVTWLVGWPGVARKPAFSGSRGVGETRTHAVCCHRCDCKTPLCFLADANPAISPRSGAVPHTWNWRRTTPPGGCRCRSR